KTAADRVRDHDEYDRNVPVGLGQLGNHRRAVTNDQVGLERDELFGVAAHARGVAGGIAVLNARIYAWIPTVSSQPILEGLDAHFCFGIVSKPHEEADRA